MKLVKRLFLFGAVLMLTAGCSKDVKEISDIALVMMTGIDYDKETNRYIFTAHCVLPSASSTEKSSKQHEWAASANGVSIMDAARNLRSRAGKTLVWQHDKFFIIGQDAATHAFYDIVDFLTRNRDLRISGYILVSEGKAADKLAVKSDTNDLVANDFLGITANQYLWGKSVSLMVKDVSNMVSNPYRGFVTGRVTVEKPLSSSKEVLALKGGSVFDKGKFVDWLDGRDTIAVYLLSRKREWRKVEFPISIRVGPADVTLLMQFPKKTFHFRETDEGPALDVDVSLKAALMDTDRHLALYQPDTMEQLERTAGKQVEQMMAGSLNYFQKDLRVDVLGLSDYIRQYHPKQWSRMKDKWEDIYPALPVKIHVTAQLSKIGMNELLEGT
jgi:Ger(x)C family germination protein